MGITWVHSESIIKYINIIKRDRGKHNPPAWWFYFAIPTKQIGLKIGNVEIKSRKHRTFPILKEFVKADVDVIIVAAGMEGALASVISSMVNVPVIGVPTSVGYGYGEKGIAALASMLQSCSLGLSVVNIDNGIGAGAVAAKIANQNSKK